MNKILLSLLLGLSVCSISYADMQEVVVDEIFEDGVAVEESAGVILARPSPPPQPMHKLLGQTLDDPVSLHIMETEQRKPHCSVTSEKTILLHKNGFSSIFGCGKGCSDPARASTDSDNVRLLHDGKLS